MSALAFSHNPDTFVERMWVVLAYTAVVLAYAAIAAIVLLIGVAIVRAVLVARSSAKQEKRSE